MPSVAGTAGGVCVSCCPVTDQGPKDRFSSAMQSTPPTDPVFSELAPARVWAHFAMLCRIPRQPKGEGALREQLRAWALARGLAAQVDSAGNLLLGKPASAG